MISSNNGVERFTDPDIGPITNRQRSCPQEHKTGSIYVAFPFFELSDEESKDDSVEYEKVAVGRRPSKRRVVQFDDEATTVHYYEGPTKAEKFRVYYARHDYHRMRNELLIDQWREEQAQLK
jgi:hypothetical protein